MQVVKESELNQYDPEFEPVYIILESQEEVDLMSGVFSYSPLLDCLKRELNDLVERLFCKLNSVGTVGYRKYFDKIDSGLTRK